MKTNTTKGTIPQPMNPTHKPPFLSWLILLMLIVGGANFRSAFAEAPSGQSLNEKMTSQAWAFFEKGDYRGAIKAADECISKFKASADREQKALDAAKEEVPASPDDAQERDRIFKRGPLNDVATCYYIVGESHLKLASRETGEAAKVHRLGARNAYETTTLYTGARTFDATTFDPATKRGGWFWSPSQEAKDALAKHFSGAK